MKAYTFVLNNGGRINVRFIKDKLHDEAFEDFEQMVRRNDFWMVDNYEGVEAEYEGVYLRFIDTRKIIGWY